MKRTLLILISGFLAGAPHLSIAQLARTWTGGAAGGNTQWNSTAVNWDPAPPNVGGYYAPEPLDHALFGAAGTAGTIFINLTQPNNGPENQAIGAITLLPDNTLDRIIRSSSSSPANGDGVLTLNGFNGVLLSNASSASLTITNGTVSTRPLGVALAATGDIFVTGGSLITIGSTISGSHGFVKTGEGRLNLRAVNAYSGDTWLREGTIGLTASSTFGNGTGTLHLEGGNIVTLATRTAANAMPNPIVMSADTFIEGSNNQGLIRNWYFSTDSITTTGGTLTIRHNVSLSEDSGFRLRFTGGGFDFSQPIIVGLDNVPETAVAILDFNSNDTRADQVFSGAISGVGRVSRTLPADNSGPGGKTILTGNNTYSGGTTVSGGQLWVNNSEGSGTGSGEVVVSGTGVLGGSGNVGGALTLNEGGAVSPGNSVGTLTTGSQTWNSGGQVLLELNQLDGTAGGPLGWDLLDIAGTLLINATSENKFFIRLASLALDNLPGEATGFDSSTGFSMAFLKTTGGITLAAGEVSDVLEVTTADFHNDLGGGIFTVGLANENQDLHLIFTPIPEPSAGGLLLLAALLSRCFRRSARR